MHVCTSIEEISAHEFLDSELFKSDTDNFDLVSIKDWLNRGNLASSQPTIGSPKSTEKDNNTALILPQFSKCDILDR
jgi:hypothetical protein